MTNTEKIEQALKTAARPINIDQICCAAFGRIDEHVRNNVRVVLHRLDQAGKLVKHAQAYELRR
jgi:predicted Zn-ribbon and HTH transcriptional regulator